MTAPKDVVLDTNVWVALARRELHPARLRRDFGDGRVLVPPIVVAELASLVAQRKLSASVKKRIQAVGVPAPLEGPEAWAGGSRHGRWRRLDHRAGGLADALLLEAARSRKAVLVTFDPDFEGEPGVHMLTRDGA